MIDGIFYYTSFSNINVCLRERVRSATCVLQNFRFKNPNPSIFLVFGKELSWDTHRNLPEAFMVLLDYETNNSLFQI